MKNLLIFTLLVLGIFCGFIYYKTGVVPVNEWSEQLQRDGLAGTLKKISAGEFVAQAKKMASEATGGTFATPQAAKVQIYKWTDEKGVVHYDNQPVKNAQELTIDPNANILPMANDSTLGGDEKPVVDDSAQQAMENIEKMRAATEKRLGI